MTDPTPDPAVPDADGLATTLASTMSMAAIAALCCEDDARNVALLGMPAALTGDLLPIGGAFVWCQPDDEPWHWALEMHYAAGEGAVSKTVMVRKPFPPSVDLDRLIEVYRSDVARRLDGRRRARVLLQQRLPAVHDYGGRPVATLNDADDFLEALHVDMEHGGLTEDEAREAVADVMIPGASLAVSDGYAKAAPFARRVMQLEAQVAAAMALAAEAIDHNEARRPQHSPELAMAALEASAALGTVDDDQRDPHGGPGTPAWQPMRLLVIARTEASGELVPTIVQASGAGGEFMIGDDWDLRDSWLNEAPSFSMPPGPGAWVYTARVSWWSPWNAGGSPMEAGCALWAPSWRRPSLAEQAALMTGTLWAEVETDGEGADHG